jgi:hypothetical protein
MKWLRFSPNYFPGLNEQYPASSNQLSLRIYYEEIPEYCQQIINVAKTKFAINVPELIIVCDYYNDKKGGFVGYGLFDKPFIVLHNIKKSPLFDTATGKDKFLPENSFNLGWLLAHELGHIKHLQGGIYPKIWDDDLTSMDEDLEKFAWEVAEYIFYQLDDYKVYKKYEQYQLP